MPDAVLYGSMMSPDLITNLVANEEDLDEILSRPGRDLVEFIGSVRSPLLLLGAGGKMGPTLALMAKRAAKQAGHPLEVIAVSRFSNQSAKLSLESQGIHTISCDLLSAFEVEKLPQAGDIIFLAGQKFGTSADPSTTWAINTLIPANVCRRYSSSRIVALSTGSIYSLTPVSGRGSLETDPLAPQGEYASSCLARERIFEHFSNGNGTRTALIRLFYAVELRYGVLVDIALSVFQDKPVDLTMGYLNWIWQGDACDMILRALALASGPPSIFNLTSPMMYSVRELAMQFGQIMERKVTFTGEEASTALLGDAGKLCALLGEPAMPPEQVVAWTAKWVLHQHPLLGKPTHFEVRDGNF